MKKYLSPVKAIRKFCYECAGRSSKERKECEMTNCPLYPFRLGENPNRKGIGGRKPRKNPKFAQKP